MADNQTDRPLYEDLLQQRNALESLVKKAAIFVPKEVESSLLDDLEAIVGENRKRERLT